MGIINEFGIQALCEIPKLQAPNPFSRTFHSRALKNGKKIQELWWKSGHPG